MSREEAKATDNPIRPVYTHKVMHSPNKSTVASFVFHEKIKDIRAKHVMTDSQGSRKEVELPGGSRSG